MKKIVPFLLCLSLLLTACAALVPAAALSAEVNDSTWSDVVLKALIRQDDTIFSSDMAEDYEDYEWGWKEISELEDDELQLAQINMRGFAMTPDHKYALMGHLNGGQFRGCALYDLETGMITDVFYRYCEETPDDVCPFSFPKGIAADDRGNVYVGFAFCQNYNVVDLGIAHINDETKTFEQLYLEPVFEFGDPGNAGGIKVGVNGVEVAKIGEEYYCYIMTNYAYDALYCYNVTDPANPTLNTDFGDNGVIVFSEEDCTVKGNGFTLDDGDYLAIDEEGAIWLAAASKEGSRGVMKISADGSACLDVVAATKAYSVCRAGNYLIVGDKDGVLLHVYDVNDTSAEIASISLGEDVSSASRYSRVQVCGDILFAVSNQENDNSLPNVILAAALTADAEVELSNMVKSLNGENVPVETEPTETEPTETEPTETDPTETEPTETDPTETEPTETDPVGIETAPADDDSATEPVVTDAATTVAATEAATTVAGTDAATTATEEDGCSSVIGAGAVALVLSAMAAAVALKKKN